MSVCYPPVREDWFGVRSVARAPTVRGVSTARPVAVAALLGLTPLAAPAAADGAPACSKAAARKAIRTTPQAAPLRATLDGPFAQIAQLWCRDVTRDGVGDMTVTVSGGGTAGVTGWAVFRTVGARRRLVLLRPDGQHFRIRLTRRSEIWEQYPVYRAHDPGCCPTGGYENRRFRWDGTRLVVARRWHTTDAG